MTTTTSCTLNGQKIDIDSAPQKPVVFRLDPTGATKIILGSTIKPTPQEIQQETNNWPEGFWDYMNTADHSYTMDNYQQAKDAYIAAHSLLSSYVRLNTALLRTYRKMYKTAIDEKRFDEAYKEICEMFSILPNEVTDTDRKKLNKVVDVLKKTNPDFSWHTEPLLLNKKDKIKPEKPTVKTEHAVGIDINVYKDETYNPDNERYSTLTTQEITPNGCVTIENFHIGYPSTKYSIITYTKQGDIVSETDLQACMEKSNPFGMRVCSMGEYFVGCSEDLQLFLWSLNGNLIAERKVKCDEVGSVRYIAISGDAQHCLFTIRGKIYIFNQWLHTQCIWNIPYRDRDELIEKVSYKVNYNTKNVLIEEALTTLELIGHPTQDEIKTQFRKMAFLHHPDRNPEDIGANERMKEILASYKTLSGVDVRTALEDIEQSITLSFAFSPDEDQILASHITLHAERIYLGCYTGKVYCMDLTGKVLKVYSTVDGILGIRERGSYLYIWTDTNMYVLKDDKVINQIIHPTSLFDDKLTWSEWGFIFKSDRTLILYSEDGTWLGTIQFPGSPYKGSIYKIIPNMAGLVAYASKQRYHVSLSFKAL